jgi:hypothetical protein
MSMNERIGGGMPGDAERDPRLDRLYHEASREEPPAHLDAAILAAAHREAGARPRPLSARLHAWRVPVSIAAVVVLSVSLVTLVREEGGGELDSPTASMSSREVAKAPALQRAPVAGQTQDRAQPSEPASGAAGRSRERAKQEQPPARDDAAQTRQEAAKTAEDSARRAAKEELARREEQARRSAGAGQPAAPEARAPVPATSAPQPFQDAPALREQHLAPSDPVSGSSGSLFGGTRGNGDRSESTGASSELKAAPEAGPVPREREAVAPPAQQPSVAPAPAMKQDMPRAKMAARPPAKAASQASGPATALIRELELQPAEKWVEKVEALRRDGRRTEADELLVEFRRRFPDYSLPAELR